MESFDFGGQIVWTPSAELIAQTNLKRLMDRFSLPDLAAFQKKSTDDIEWFWKTVFDDLGIEFYKPYDRLIDLSRDIQHPRWCVGGEMNIVHNLLDRHEGKSQDDRIAIRYESEDSKSRTLTYSQLRLQVNRAAGGLRAMGLGKGDAIGVFVPFNVECVVAMLAIIKIGGIFVPLFSGFGASAIVSRLSDAKAKALITADGVVRRGKIVNMKSVADDACSQVPSVKHLIVINSAGCDTAWNEQRDRWWHHLVQDQPGSSLTERTGADDVMMLIYTSGTTGRPKGAVHSHCGFPIKSAQDMYHCMDVKPDEVLWWMSDIGWMMGPWLVFGTLLNGCTMVLYDGAPDFPDASRVWATCERNAVTMLGISPTLVRSLMKFGDEPVRKHNLSNLRKFGSTGEPWNPASWMWLFETVGASRVPIINYSGGTEISGGIICGNLLSPLKPCAFSGACPGIDADVVDENGTPVRGRVGELVIRKPWIGMTRSFWNDDARYVETYWSRLKNVWVHGDFAAIDDDGLWYILGRSDDTIKIAGKRLGPAEVESILTSDPSVAEAAAIGAPDPVKGECLVCFAVLKPGITASDELRKRLSGLVTRELGKALAPKAVLFATDLPKTRNAKVMRRVIRASYLQQSPGDITSLENPGAIEAIRAAT